MILEIAGLLLFLGVALFLMLPMWRAMRRQARQGKWPRVQALITQQQLRQDGPKGFPEFRVQYQYEGVAQERWVGVPDGTSLTMIGGKTQTAVNRSVRAYWAKHPVGSQVPVMINPENADEAYFAERELAMRVIFFLVLGVFAVFFVLFAYVAFS